ncbi:DUF4363 family protein [Solibaculum mannosilyticum]|uniref:DUF4363 domain-containing protein n=1 Tax=Solibaculum mannosilyticum TaxID=2780922 RepID=A0A7I8CZQ1_9FIRM|nr:DUF4363 family protein [Solibaculum mannosilyticum]MCO7136944.1 DUF4363 family protein [[Clostridium] leptum]BCI59967.1 hypothetical protein C12CBH8_06060 [Solibaculum mannosilyticum]CZT57112.1 hypothetical protein BN3661_01803 [Eubacteriaceae bacterium CHKCI005]
MKRIWTAVALLLIISILGGIGIAVVHRQTDTLTDTIGQAQDAALNGEIQKAIEISQELSRQWKKSDVLLSIMIRHDQMDHIVFSIESMIPHLQQDQIDDFLDDCTSCTIALTEIWNSEVPSLENIL